MHMSNKVTIIGAGSVGSTIAYTMTVKGIASEIVLIDINAEKRSGKRWYQAGNTLLLPGNGKFRNV